MICGTSAPKASNYMPGVPQGPPAAETKQGHLPPPPPPPVARQSLDQSRNQHAQGDANRQWTGEQIRERMPVAPSSQSNNGQQWSTQLPPQGQRPSHGQPPGGAAPWEQNRSHMGARPYNPNLQAGNRNEDGFAGFLKLVAGDIWKTCNNDSRGVQSPERPFMRRGGA